VNIILNMPGGNIHGDEFLKLGLALVVGCILGIEREIRGKSAGFRTLALICFGATVFTICSYKLGVDVNRDRIAANIITGVGFIGAGVIFRNNASVSGITTAATIWIAAALGMIIGIGEYFLAAVSLVFALFILYALDFIQFWIDDHFQHRNYRITFKTNYELDVIKEQVSSRKLKMAKTKILRLNEQTIIVFDVSGKCDNLNLFNEWLVKNETVLSFDW
jgi:putative Mg2+ transporter-C (MgtC) family protein